MRFKKAGLKEQSACARNSSRMRGIADSMVEIASHVRLMEARLLMMVAMCCSLMLATRFGWLPSSPETWAISTIPKLLTIDGLRRISFTRFSNNGATHLRRNGGVCHEFPNQRTELRASGRILASRLVECSKYSARDVVVRGWVAPSGLADLSRAFTQGCARRTRSTLGYHRPPRWGWDLDRSGFPSVQARGSYRTHCFEREGRHNCRRLYWVLALNP